MKRILLKISGEALSSDTQSIDPQKAEYLAREISYIQKSELELILVFWWGNIYRGSQLIASWVDPADSHNMSMLSTVFNCVTIKNSLDKLWIKSIIMDALQVEFLEKYSAMWARGYLSEGKIVISSSGWGSPFFTTDTAWVLRALETHCEAMIKLTKVDGVFDSDPVKDPHAQKFENISYDDFISQDLRALDQTAVIMARDSSLPIYVMNINSMSDIPSLLDGKKLGTRIS